MSDILQRIIATKHEEVAADAVHRSLASLRGAYDGAGKAGFDGWRARVAASLPGVTASANQPSIVIDDARRVTLTLNWQSPGEAAAHRLVTVAVIAD